MKIYHITVKGMETRAILEGMGNLDSHVSGIMAGSVPISISDPSEIKITEFAPLSMDWGEDLSIKEDSK